MKTLEQVKDEVAQNAGFMDYNHYFIVGGPDLDLTDEIAER